MERLLYSIADAGAALGIGRSKVYQLMGEGKISTVRIGQSMIVPFRIGQFRIGPFRIGQFRIGQFRIGRCERIAPVISQNVNRIVRTVLSV